MLMTAKPDVIIDESALARDDGSGENSFGWSAQNGLAVHRKRLNRSRRTIENDACTPGHNGDFATCFFYLYVLRLGGKTIFNSRRRNRYLIAGDDPPLLRPGRVVLERE